MVTVTKSFSTPARETQHLRFRASSRVPIVLPRIAGCLVIGGFFHASDNENFDRSFGGVELEPELFLDRSK